MSNEELRKLRERYRDLSARADRLAASSSPVGSPRWVGKVYSGGAIPTSVPNVFLTHPVTVFSPDTEGGTATTEVDTSVSVPVWVTGPGVPVAGNYLIARGVNFAWVADFPASPTITRCNLVSWPNTLFITTGGHTYTMTRTAGNNWASALTNVTGIGSKGNRTFLTQPCPDTDGGWFTFHLTCNTGTGVWSVFYTCWITDCAITGNPTDWKLYGINSALSTGQVNSGTIVWTDTPVSVTGTWTTAVPSFTIPITGTYAIGP